MKQLYISCFILSFVILLSACTSTKPIYNSKTTHDYNERTRIRGIEYKYKTNPIGYLTVAAGTAIGGYYAYNSDLIQYNTKTDLSPVNAAIGGLAGFGLSSLLNYWIAKKDKKEPYTHKGRGHEDWLKKHEKRYILLEGSGTTIKAIDNIAEADFTIKNGLDAAEYKLAFGDTKYIDGFIARDFPTMDRDDLTSIIDHFPSNSSAHDIKVKYQKTSPTIRSLFAATDKYPETGIHPEYEALSLINSYNDFDVFNNRFPNSKYVSQIANRIYSTFNFYEGFQFLKQYNSIPEAKKIASHTLSKATSLKEVIKLVKANKKLLKKIPTYKKGMELIHSREDAITYIKSFKKSPYNLVYQDDYVAYDKVVFIGYHEENLPNGKGVIIDKDRPELFIKGTWSIGKPEGEFEVTTAYETYNGSYSDGKKSGQGSITTSWYTYTGKWSKGEPNGYGVRKEGDITYTGTFFNGLLKGEGSKDYGDGDWIKGNFYEGEPHGQCERRISDGYRIKGKYIHGNPVGTHSVKKWTLFGLVTTYEGEVVFDNNGNVLSTSDSYDINGLSGGSDGGDGWQITKGKAYVTKMGTQSHCYVSVTDGGFLSSNVDSDLYSVIFSSKYGEEDRYDDPFNDSHGFFGDAPYSVTISYRKNKSDSFKIIQVIFSVPGQYDIKIPQW